MWKLILFVFRKIYFILSIDLSRARITEWIEYLGDGDGERRKKENLTDHKEMGLNKTLDIKSNIIRKY